MVAGDTGRILLWVVALLFFGFGDTLTSLAVFKSGGSEANPLLGWVLVFVGPTALSFIAVKAVATLVVVVVARLQRHLELPGSLAMLSVGVYLVVRNTEALV